MKVRYSVIAFLAVSAGCLGNDTTTPDGSPPQLLINAPANNATVGNNVTIDISAIDDNGVDKVRVLIDGTLLQELYTAPYYLTWNTRDVTNNTTHTIRVEAYDFSGNTSVQQVTVTVSRSGPGFRQP